MKKQLLFLSMAVMGLGAFAQTTSMSGKIVPVTPTKSLSPKAAVGERNLNCDNDTLYYSYAKEAIQAVPDFGGFPVLAGAPGAPNAYSQAFTNTGSVTISGATFWGFVLDRINPAQSLTVSVGIFNVSGTNVPTTSLASANITITGMVDDFYSVNFSSPVTVTSNFAVVITNASTTDTLGLVVNNAATTTYGEGLAKFQFGGTWYSPSMFLAPSDYEAVLAPIVSYPIATDYTYAPSVICTGQVVNFTNTTTSTAILGNKMFNWNKFKQAYGLAPIDSTYAWDFDGVSPAVWSTNASHTYATAGAYTPTLYTLAGFWNSCVDDKIVTVNANVCTDINEASKDAVSIYPNPSTGLFTVNFTSTTKGIIEVYNVIGEVVYTSQVMGTTATIDLSSLNAGIYSVKVSAENTNITKSIVLTK
jgi:hypothetical protein